MCIRQYRRKCRPDHEKRYLQICLFTYAILRMMSYCFDNFKYAVVCQYKVTAVLPDYQALFPLCPVENENLKYDHGNNHGKQTCNISPLIHFQPLYNVCLPST